MTGIRQQAADPDTKFAPGIDAWSALTEDERIRLRGTSSNRVFAEGYAAALAVVEDSRDQP